MSTPKQNKMTPTNRALAQTRISEWLKHLGSPPAVHDFDALFSLRHYDQMKCHATAAEPLRIIEFKMQGKQPDWSQRRTLDKMHDGLSKGLPPGEYAGTFVVSFEGEEAAKSEAAYVSCAPEWRREKWSLEEVEGLLRLDDLRGRNDSKER